MPALDRLRLAGARVKGSRPAPGFAVAAVLYSRGDPIEQFMSTVAERLRVDGIRTGGLLQHNGRKGERRCLFEFEDLISGARYPLTQNLGPGSQSCALDAGAFAEATNAIRRALAARVQLVIINKFGEQEATGHGMRNEMIEVLMAGVPLLTSVGRRYLPDWLRFVGADALLLPMSLDSVLSFCVLEQSNLASPGTI